jgi:hypothetical protein
MRSKPSQHLLSIIDLAKWAPLNHKKHEFDKRIARTNEATGLIVLSPNSAQKKLDFSSIMLRVAKSVPEEHELVAQTLYPRR